MLTFDIGFNGSQLVFASMLAYISQWAIAADNDVTPDQVVTAINGTFAIAAGEHRQPDQMSMCHG